MVIMLGSNYKSLNPRKPPFCLCSGLSILVVPQVMDLILLALAVIIRPTNYY